MGMLVRDVMFCKGSKKPKVTGAVNASTVTVTINSVFAPFTVNLLDDKGGIVQSKRTSSLSVAFSTVAAGTYSAIVTDQNFNSGTVTGLVVA